MTNRHMARCWTHCPQGNAGHGGVSKPASIAFCQLQSVETPFRPAAPSAAPACFRGGPRACHSCAGAGPAPEAEPAPGAGPRARTSPARGETGAGPGTVTQRDAQAGQRPLRQGSGQRAAGRGSSARCGPMLLPLACLHGRVAQCLTALLVLTEPPPRPRRGARAHGAPPPRAKAALPVKMAAELYAPAGAAAATATDIANSNAAAAGRKSLPSAPPPAPPPPAPSPPAPDNNNLESPNWQSFHPTLRER